LVQMRWVRVRWYNNVPTPTEVGSKFAASIIPRDGKT
jgi:hypothetical protein